MSLYNFLRHKTMSRSQFSILDVGLVIEIYPQGIITANGFSIVLEAILTHRIVFRGIFLRTRLLMVGTF